MARSGIALQCRTGPRQAVSLPHQRQAEEALRAKQWKKGQTGREEEEEEQHGSCNSNVFV
jgi:hypothetical protein